MHRWMILGSVAFFVQAACSSRDEAPQPRAPASTSTSATAAAERDSGGATPGACYLSDTWSPCLLEKALENAGLAPTRLDSVRHGFLSVSGQRWSLGRAELQTFLYPTAERLRADLAGFDTEFAQPRKGDRVDWPGRPSVIVSRNLLAVFAGASERQEERVRNALEAGVLTTRPQ